MIHRALLITMTLAFGASCGGTAPTATTAQRPEETETDPSNTEPSVDEPGGSVAEGTERPPAEPGEAATFADATNRFATDLWQQLRTEPGNLVVSPASIEVALAMTWGGARGTTAAQMADVMHFGAEPDALHRAAGAALASWNDPEREAYRLAVANRLFGQQGYTWREPFLELTANTYGAPLEALDFRGATEASRQHINGWVEDQTEDRIQELLPEGTIQDNTRMVLVNAVYFLADWQHQFSANDTRERVFHAAGGDVQAETMHQQARFGYAETADLQVLEMPYAGGDLGMMVVLPRRNDGLEEVEADLSADGIAAWASALEAQTVKVALPKYELAPASVKLAEVLKGMGMTEAFDMNAADFSAMADPAANEGQPLYLDDVVHKAFVAVDEEGTEAAAATAVVVGVRSAAIHPPDVPSFVADHPFLFFIRDRQSGAILFMGRVLDPTA